MMTFFRSQHFWEDKRTKKNMSINLSHHPVLVDEVISIINPQDKKLYFDGTFGQGGYSKKLLLKKKSVK